MRRAKRAELIPFSAQREQIYRANFRQWKSFSFNLTKYGITREYGWFFTNFFAILPKHSKTLIRE